MKRAFLILILIFSISCGDSKMDAVRKSFSTISDGYVLFITKKNFRLDVFNRDLKLMATYKIGFGKNPDMKPKLYEGDDRTPEGEYRINEILSMDSGRDSESYRKLSGMNRVYFKKVNGYHRYRNPELDLGDNAYGPRYYGIDYPNDQDRVNYRKGVESGEVTAVNGKIPGIGYGIAIHGNNDEDSIGHLCSSGCIRMYNTDIVDLEKYIKLSTPVIIVND